MDTPTSGSPARKRIQREFTFGRRLVQGLIGALVPWFFFFPGFIVFFTVQALWPGDVRERTEFVALFFLLCGAAAVVLGFFVGVCKRPD